MRRPFLFLLCGLLLTLAFHATSANWTLLELTQQRQTGEIKIEPKLFDEFVGQYSFSDDPEFVMSFWREGDKFFVQPTSQSKIQIFPESESRFFLKVVSAKVTFVRDSQGKITSILWHQNEEDRPAIRISDKPAVEVFEPFEKREVMIRTRDGVRLHTLIFVPKNQTGPLPILFNRTPYGAGTTTAEWINRRQKEFVKDGYIFAFQDIRGRHESEGQFVMSRPLRDKRDTKSIDETTDTYDSIEWLVKNVENNNGRVGILGVSYDGWLAAVATIDCHPALKAASPQAPMTDAYLGDDFFHNGAFRQSYGYEYVKAMESSKEETEVVFDKDAYDWYLEWGTLSKLGAGLGAKLPTWNAFVEHPNYDDYWQARGAGNYLKQTDVATLVVGGWWDQEDFYGALKAYEALEKFDKANKNFIVLGPWNHGGWNGRGRNLGKIKFGSATGVHFRKEIQAPWFAYYLKDKGRHNEPEAVTFQTGSNQWASYDRWPPRESTGKALYLRSGRKLSFEKPNEDEHAYQSYDSDPANPAPYRKRPIEATYDSRGSGWSTWLVQDQRFLIGRPDVISWQSEVLAQDLTISGEIVAHLFASTTGSDSDWVVKLIDVYPDSVPEDQKMAGYQLMVANEIFRGRFRQSFQKPTAIEPGEVNEYVIGLHSMNHTFKKGHRVMVQVQSSWFPLYDRNPQKFVQNIFKAEPADFQVATQRIYESSRYPSRLNLPVLGR